MTRVIGLSTTRSWAALGAGLLGALALAACAEREREAEVAEEGVVAAPGVVAGEGEALEGREGLAAGEGEVREEREGVLGAEGSVVEGGAVERD